MQRMLFDMSAADPWISPSLRHRHAGVPPPGVTRDKGGSDDGAAGGVNKDRGSATPDDIISLETTPAFLWLARHTSLTQRQPVPALTGKSRPAHRPKRVKSIKRRKQPFKLELTPEDIALDNAD